MAWHSGKPADGDFLSASVQHIRENFAELEPLHPHIGELVDLTTLQPHVAELVDLTALHPYIDALLDSRIVDHNLDVPNPPNGYYVRWQNGLQLCWTGIAGWGLQQENKEDDIWVFPAAFNGSPRVVGFPESYNEHPVHFWIREIRSDGNRIPFNESQVPISRYRLSSANNYESVHLLAIGRWK